MVGNLFRRVQVFRHQGWRHHESISKIRKSFARCTVNRKFTCRSQSGNTRQIPNRIGVLDIIKSTQYYPARVPGTSLGFRLEIPTDPLLKLRPVTVTKLRCILGGHLASFQYLADLLPGFWFLSNFGERRKRRQIDLGLRKFLRMTFFAVARHDRPNIVHVCRSEFTKLLRFFGGRIRRHQDKTDQHHTGSFCHPHSPRSESNLITATKAFKRSLHHINRPRWMPSKKGPGVQILKLASHEASEMVSRRWANFEMGVTGIPRSHW